MSCFIKRLALLCLASSLASAADLTWQAEVFPCEREILTDPDSSARLIYVTTDSATDTNLYFHQRSWLPDSSLLLFHSARPGAPGLYGYIEATGELARLQPAGIGLQGDVTASRHGNFFYVIHDKKVVEWHPVITPGTGGQPSTVALTEREVGMLPDFPGGVMGLNENSDGTLLVTGFRAEGQEPSHLVWMERATGAIKAAISITGPISHVQASWTDPGLAMFTVSDVDRARIRENGELGHRMWLARVDQPEPWKLYPQLEGELATHECFWVANKVVFCTGIPHEGHAELAHVKVIDTVSNVASIVLPGSWWPAGTPEDMARLNWWHASGAPNGKYVAADNWHGVIAIASAATARDRVLTTGHRTYGSGAHPHVGWDPTGYRVVFNSSKRGNPDICIAEIPEAWRTDW